MLQTTELAASGKENGATGKPSGPSAPSSFQVKFADLPCAG